MLTLGMKCKLLSDIKLRILKTKAAVCWKCMQNAHAVVWAQLNGKEESMRNVNSQWTTSLGHSLKWRLWLHRFPVIIQKTAHVLHLNTLTSKLVSLLPHSPFLSPFLTISSENFSSVAAVLHCQAEYAQHISFIYKIQCSTEKAVKLGWCYLFSKSACSSFCMLL